MIGTGAISQEHLRFLHDHPRARLAAVCDLSPVAARYAADRYGAASAHTDHHRMLEQVQPDVVHVLTPPHTHEAIAEDCLVGGAHVICEKPVALSVDGFTRLWQRATEVGRYLVEDQNYRYNDPILRMTEMVADGTLGKVREVDVRLALGLREDGRLTDRNLPSPLHGLPGGVIHDFLPHLCYLLLHFLGGEHDAVEAMWSNSDADGLFIHDELDALVTGPSGHGRLRVSCRTLPEMLSVTVRGTRGFVETDLFQPFLRCVVPRAGGGKLSPLANQAVNGWAMLRSSETNLRRKVMQRTPYEGMHRLLEATYVALAEGRPPPIGFAEMDGSTRLADALIAQARVP